LDKPSDITSNELLQKVKRLYKANKAGHTGSLDKMASGLLPVCMGEATKYSGFLLNADKHYLADCKLGIETTTGDALGDEVRTLAVPNITEQQINDVLQQFREDIEQVPPMYSALKHRGQRLYKLAYQGIVVERPPRPVSIHKLELVKFKNNVMTIDVICSKGTYIRTLAEDIGRVLGTVAHVSFLRRTGVGPFGEEHLISLSELEQIAAKRLEYLDSKLLSIDAALMDMPAVELGDNVREYLYDGQAVIVPHAQTEGMLRIYTDKKEFLGIGEVLDDGMVAPRKLVNFQIK